MKSALKIRSSICDYINHRSLERVQLKCTLESIALRLPEVAIFGGMLREFALGNARNFTSDIDMVASASRAEIYGAIKQFSPSLNKFGGFRFIVDRRSFDIWSFSDTWAFREGLVRGSNFSDLFKTTFFNLDAAAFRLEDQELTLSEECSQGISDRILEINLETNPAPQSMVYRAIRLAAEKDLSIGIKLADFLLKNSKGLRFDFVGELFIEGLRAHRELDPLKPYLFNPQRSILNSLKIGGKNATRFLVTSTFLNI